MATYNHVCELCGKEFSDYFENTKFCCRDCYDKNRKRISICQWCGKEFNNPSGRQKYCSRKCSAEMQSKKVLVTCAVCGLEFKRKPSDVRKGNNYCSRKCSNKVIYWNKSDLNFVKNNYGDLSIQQIADKLGKTYYSVKDAISYHGYAKNRKWTSEEEKIMIDFYNNTRLSEIVKMIPSRTRSAITGKAMSLGLRGYVAYTDEDNQYLKDNYLELSNEEMGKHLNKTKDAICLHLISLGLKRPQKEADPMTPLNQYIRGRLIPWKESYMRENNYTCELTGKERDIVIHHILGFNLILEQAIVNLDLELKPTIGDYADSELEKLFDEFYQIQEDEQLYICINKEVHKQFHGLYGYGNNTEEQWNEFIRLYFNK